MSQLERGEALCADLGKIFPEIDRIAKGLRDLLDEVQNDPPDGNADGTVSPYRYNRLRDVEQAVSRLVLTFRNTDNDMAEPGRVSAR
jgi:hypothetical protein